MTCHADLSVDEVVLDLYLLPVSRFISEHPWFKVYAPFPPYKYQQLMTCRECHLICHDDKMPRSSIHVIFMAVSLMSPPWYYYSQDITYFSKRLTFCL